MEEQFYDGMLHIKTGGVQKGFIKSVHYHRYEPTPYHALDTLFQQYELKKGDRVVDFGCGKGRLIFYSNYYFHVPATGVEMNEVLYQEAVENRNYYLKVNKKAEEQVSFYLGLAEEYPIHSLDNRFYFFNPFTIAIFRKIIDNILLSVEESPRDVELVLYYPSEDYIYFLENHTSFVLKEEIIHIDNNINERFLIYSLVY